MSHCQYKKIDKDEEGNKYELTTRFKDKLYFGPKLPIITKYCCFFPDGTLYIEAKYRWDGPSGPAIDTDNFMDGSLVHDLLYQLLREGLLKPRWLYRMKADKEMRRQCKKDRMFFLRRWWTWLGVRIGGYWSAK